MNLLPAFAVLSPVRAALLLAALASASPIANAHVTLAPGGATTGTTYEAAFRVGHACKDTAATTGITVRLPAGFVLESVVPRAGWTLAVAGDQVQWQAPRPEAALPTAERAEFIVRGKVTAAPGVLWFAVLQSCDRGSADWAQVPSTAAPKPEFPAARLDVLPAGVAAVQVRGAWAAASGAGSSASGVFMTLSAPTGLRLVGAASPAAGRAELAGGTPRGLDLPARQLVELRPGGDRIVLAELRQPLAAGATVPVVLYFEDAAGARSSLKLDVPVAAAEAASPSAAPAR